MDEQEAVRRLLKQDMSGLEWLVERFQKRAVRAAFLILHDGALAEDAAQTAFIQVWRNAHRFDRSRPFEPWFLRIVVNAAVRAAEQSRRVTPFPTGKDEGRFLELLADPGPGPEAHAEQRELQDRVWNALEQLSPRQRAVVVMRYYLQMSEQEMSRELGEPRGTIKWRLNAARQYLRTLLSLRSTEESHD